MKCITNVEINKIKWGYMKKELKRTYLVQRLQTPLSFEKIGLKDNPFTFGGGLKNGGLSNDAMDVLRSIFSFDYMGSAEFEWGAIPQSLTNIVENLIHYSAHSIEINKVPVYIICNTEQYDLVEQRVRELAVEQKLTLKEYCGLELCIIDILKNRPYRFVGWLELNNDFMFFVDKEVFKNVVNLFLMEWHAK